MMSQGRRCCDVVGSSQTLDLRHSGVSEVEQDQRLQRCEAYRVVGLLRASLAEPSRGLVAHFCMIMAMSLTVESWYEVKADLFLQE
ncbi:hypothetical protein NDU88_003053 [Pleurodeles waltl]|uniref:Uncharacterized protein n=1 Tax=Pleurodeles waltl TaxID=8319 RepID=A0AAV7KUG7_PLEWA|nr:hypothetical protein NDU88_003053 [Pleurodeles waltl]